MKHDDIEENHIRNSLCHLRYTLTPCKKIILYDHPNGARNEKNITFYKFVDLDELYSETKFKCFESDKSYYFKQ